MWLHFGEGGDAKRHGEGCRPVEVRCKQGMGGYNPEEKGCQLRHVETNIMISDTSSCVDANPVQRIAISDRVNADDEPMNANSD